MNKVVLSLRAHSYKTTNVNAQNTLVRGVQKQSCFNPQIFRICLGNTMVHMTEGIIFKQGHLESRLQLDEGMSNKEVTLHE